MHDMVIPILPYVSFRGTLDFYRALGEAEHARVLRAQLQQMPLSDEERERFRDELEAAEELERLLN